jgi:hypothetical protein
MTFNAATLTGTSAGDVGRVLTIYDVGSSTYKTAIITAFSSSTVATVTLNQTLTTACTNGFPCPIVDQWLSGPVYTTSNTAGAGSVIYSAPLPTTYANAWVKFQAASPIGTAGWYYCQFSYLTTAVCYNTTYTTGQPEIPGSPVAFSGLTPGTYTPFTAGTYYAGLAVSVPSTALGVNGEIDLDYSTLNDASASGTKGFQVQFGGTNIVPTTVYGTTNVYGGASVHMTNNTAASQVTTWSSIGSATAQAPVRTSINSGSTQTLQLLLGTNAGTPSTDYIVLERYSAKLYQQN